MCVKGECVYVFVCGHVCVECERVNMCMCAGCVCGVVNAEPLVIGIQWHMPLAAVIGSSLGQGHCD